MQNIYVVDKENPTREWDLLSPSPIPCKVKMENGKIVLYNVDSRVKEGIVIVHRSFFIEEKWTFKKLQKLTERYEKFFFVIISGSPQHEEQDSSSIYYRKVPVHYPVDKVFAQCWAKFIRNYYSGCIDFSHLEPQLIPTLISLDILCQGYRATHGDKDLFLAGCLPESADIINNWSTATEKLDWWFRGLGIDSTTELDEKLKEDTSGENGTEILSYINQDSLKSLDNIKKLHEIIKKQII